MRSRAWCSGWPARRTRLSPAKTSPSMGASPVSEELVIQSHRGPYSVHFEEDALERVTTAVSARAHYVIDARVAELYQRELRDVLDSPSVLLVEALETNKSLEACPSYVEHLVAHSVR